MTSPDPTTAQPLPTPPPTRKRRTRLIAAAGAGAVLLVAVTVAATIALLRGDNTSKAAAAASPPATFTAMGAIKLPTGNFLWGASGNTDLRCAGRDGYNDIAMGAQVVIKDATGATVAVGSLGQGEARIDVNNRGIDCTLRFTVPSVPAGRGFYSVEVSHRGELRYSEADMQGYLQLSLGK